MKFKNKINLMMQAPVFVFVVYSIFVFIFHLFISLRTGDDLNFYQIAADPDFHMLKFLNNFYQTWGGRVILFIPFFFLITKSIYIWRLFNTFFVFLSLYSISKLVVNLQGLSLKKQRGINLFICVVFSLIHYHVAAASIYGYINSFNYLWPMALGLFSMIPFKKTVLGEQSRSGIFLLTIPAAIFAAAQEQIAIAMLCFCGLFIGYLLYVKKKIQPFLVVQTIFAFGSAVFLYIAPGNYVRYQAELATWYPSFQEVSFFEKCVLGVVHMLHHLFNDERALILILFLLITSLFFHGKTAIPPNRAAKASACFLTLLMLFHVLNSRLFYNAYIFSDKILARLTGHDSLNQYKSVFAWIQKILYQFSIYESGIVFLLCCVFTIYLFQSRKELKVRYTALVFTLVFGLDSLLQNRIYSIVYNSIFNCKSYETTGAVLPLLCLLAFSLFIMAAIGCIYGLNAAGAYYNLLFLCGLCASFMLSFSPTIYASGMRIFYVMAIIFAMLDSYLLKKRLEN